MSGPNNGTVEALQKKKLAELEQKIKEGGGTNADHNRLIERAIRLRTVMGLPIK